MNRQLRLGELWDEWLACPVNSQHEADAEASGLLMGMRHTGSSFATNRLKAARRLSGPARVRLWPLTSYSLTISLAISMTTTRNRKPSIKFTCPPEILKVPCDVHTAWCWLKGLWGSSGGLYFPKAGYYLTMIVSDTETSRTARYALRLTGLSWSEHRNEFTIRNHEDIMTFLCNAGMPCGALDFDKTAMMRSARSLASLTSNYDTANIARSVNAANEQRILAGKILADGLLDELPCKLREVVELRLKYPDCSLGELGKKLQPQIKKSAVKYRWKKIQTLIKKI